MIDACSLQGPRENNEDAFMAVAVCDGEMDVRFTHHGSADDYTDSTSLPDGIEILLVSDGMGGLNDGEQASYLTLMLLLDELQSSLEDRMDLSEVIRGAVSRTSEGLRDNCPGSGATLVGMITSGYVSWVFNVGDSRCVMRADLGTLSTKDHSYKGSSGLTSFIGVEGGPDVNITVVGGVTDAVLFSDGLYPLFDSVGMAILDSTDSAESLCERAIELGSKDNTTCVVVHRHLD